MARLIPLEIIPPPRSTGRGLPHRNNSRGDLNTPRGFLTGLINIVVNVLRRWRANTTLSRRHIILAIIAVGAFGAYAFFPWATTRDEPRRFNSPDEAANYFFAKRILDAESLRTPESLNDLAAGIVHPRSMKVINGSLAPVSFLGLPVLYGGLALAFGRWLLPFLTPFFTALALLALYGCWRRLFGETVAVVAVALAAVHPAVWYYASRGFYHNVLFLDLIIFAWWGYWRWRETNWSLGWLVFSELTIIAALFVRLSEALWLLPLVGVFIFINWRRWQFVHLAVTITILGLAMIIGLWSAVTVYGHFWPLGYPLSNAIGPSPSRLSAALGGILMVLSPFGFSLWNIISNFFWYAFVLFLPFWALVLAGVLYNRNHGRSEDLIQHSYLLLASSLTIWLAVYYGSWDIIDTVGPAGVTLGISYARYLLPLYVVWLPYAAVALLALRKVLAARLSRLEADHNLVAYERIWLMVAFILVAAASFAQVFFDRTEGLAYVAERLRGYQATMVLMERRLPLEAVVIGDRADKTFFPERRVIVSDGRPVLSIPEVARVLPRLVEAVPTYFYTVENPSAETRRQLRRRHIELIAPVVLPDGAWFYRLIRL